MFSDINSESIRRLTEAKALLNLLTDSKDVEHSHFESKILKGSFFVLLYAALEYTLANSVQRCITKLNESQYDIHKIKPTLYSLVFNNECNAIMDAKNKKWTKRYELFSQFENSKICMIDDTLFPTSTGNIKSQQIESIWKTFGISAEIMTDVKIKSWLSTLTDNRNAIAHGRELVSVIGGRYSINELQEIYNNISGYCSYIILVFEDYIKNQDFLV